MRDGSLSAATGAYSRGRTRLPDGVAEALFARVHEQAAGGAGRRTLVLDGATPGLAHTPGLAAAYPPGRNQNGASHWPQLQRVVAQDLDTGVAERPAWGPACGPCAAGEQALTRAPLPSLPARSLLLGDVNFGVFQVVWPAQRHGHDVPVRLLPGRARRLAGGCLPEPGTERAVTWEPSRVDRAQLPGLPEGAGVPGRLLVAEAVQNGRPAPLHLFTTLPAEDCPAEPAVALYGRRWATVELDIRALKRTAHLQSLRGKTVAMAERELVLGLAAWNLVRLAMRLAAQAHGRDPRRPGFARAQSLVRAFAPGLLAAATPEAAAQELRRLLRAIAQCALPERKGPPRQYPRAVWPRARPYPTRGAVPLPPKTHSTAAHPTQGRKPK